MSAFFNRIWVWVSSQSGHNFTDLARILLPLAVLVLLALWLVGMVSDDVHRVTQSL